MLSEVNQTNIEPARGIDPSHLGTAIPQIRARADVAPREHCLEASHAWTREARHSGVSHGRGAGIKSGLVQSRDSGLFDPDEAFRSRIHSAPAIADEREKCSSGGSQLLSVVVGDDPDKTMFMAVPGAWAAREIACGSSDVEAPGVDSSSFWSS